MARSLSALLPFHNAQHLPLAVIPAYVDGLSDLTPDWELVLVDDGSTDATPEILCEIAQIYPQIRLAIHARPRGSYLSYCTALALSRGDWLFLPLSYRPVSLDGLHRIWAASQEYPIVLGICQENGTSAAGVECLMLHRSVTSPILPAISSVSRLQTVLVRFEPRVASVLLAGETVLSTQRAPRTHERPHANHDWPESLPPAPKSLTPHSSHPAETRSVTRAR